MTLIKIMDEIWDTSLIPSQSLQKIQRGRYFFLSLQKDLKKINDLRKGSGIPTDKNGMLSGENLFPLTLRLWNWNEELPGTTVIPQTSRSLELYRLHYFGVALELENFATLILWPENSRHSFETLEKIYRAIEAQKQPLIHFEGDYRIRLPNEIHPYRFSNIKLNLEDKIFEWKYIPWLKETGDTLFSHRSPANYRKVYLNLKRIEYAYINPRVSIGIVKDLLRSTGEVKLKLPYLDKTSQWHYLTVTVLHDEELIDINKGDIVFFILLETIHNDGKFVPERYIYHIEKADFIDIIGHLTSFVLYNVYLDKYGLYIMSVPEFQRIYSKVLFIASKYCKDCNKTGLIEWDLLFKSYLEPFFTIFGQRIYYVPTLLYQGQYLSALGIKFDTRLLLDKIDTLLLETREPKLNPRELNAVRIMEDVEVDSISQLRSLLDVSSKIAFIKRLNKLLKTSIWRVKS
ncbi:hypothetical protein [Thermococcus thermotolerans]|uniref:hypothetical protein n=1 Tax=Thermococcus thermotolerans TaxID=2969672 RepID=UPI002157AB0B|nr:hypothetical protein [Thermococcus thermotolerans]